MRIAVFSTDDLNRPRNDILCTGLRARGHTLTLFNHNAWKGFKDKSHLKTAGQFFGVALRYLLYPKLLLQYVFSPRHDFVLVPYLGLFDVLMLWPLAKLRREPIVWDAFLSVHDTVVGDRKLVSAKSVRAGILYALEWLAARAASAVILDTETHQEFFQTHYRLSPLKTGSTPIGAKDIFFTTPRGPHRRAIPGAQSEPFTILFFGTFIPLQGIQTIFEAASLDYPHPVRWIIVGSGHEETVIDQRWPEGSLPNLERIRWMPHAELIELMDTKADLCLGVFGTSGKAERVVPNKVYESLVRGVPLITRESRAVKNLLQPDFTGVWFVPPGEPHALRDAVIAALPIAPGLNRAELFSAAKARSAPAAVALHFETVIHKLLGAALKSEKVEPQAAAIGSK